MKILFVVTSHDRLGDSGEKTGFWLEELASPYYVFTDAGAEVVLSSPAGGQPPVDPKSALPDFQTDSTRRFDLDAKAQDSLANTVKLSDVSAEDFDAVFYPGGHGPLWDLTRDPLSIALLESFIAQDKPVSAVCHAPAVLLQVNDNTGQALIKGNRVTGFSNSEEDAVALSKIVPFLLEDELKMRGGLYSRPLSTKAVPMCL